MTSRTPQVNVLSPDGPSLKMSSRPQVSVLIIAYNHANYIVQAVRSALEQRTSFEFEIVVGEDCSTDDTRPLLADLQRRHPDRLRLLLHEQNLGMLQNLAATFAACRGRYVALLEGDDYWTCPEKLQRQVDFLEAHPEFSICHHNAERLVESETPARSLWHPPGIPERQTLDDLLVENRIVTCSAMYRNGLVRKLPDWYFNAALGDWPLHVLHARHGLIGYLDSPMAVYRVHAGGVWSGRPESGRLRGLVHTATLMQNEVSPPQRQILVATVQRYQRDLIETLILEGARDEAESLLLEQGLPAGGLQRLWWYYTGLDAERSGRRGGAAARFLRGLLTARRRTHIYRSDLLKGIVRVMMPRVHRVACSLKRSGIAI